MVVVANKFAIELTGKILLQPLILDDKLNLRYRNQTATDANRIIHNTQFMSNRWWFRLHMYSAIEGSGVLIPVGWRFEERVNKIHIQIWYHEKYYHSTTVTVSHIPEIYCWKCPVPHTVLNLFFVTSPSASSTPTHTLMARRKSYWVVLVNRVVHRERGGHVSIKYNSH